MTGPTDTSRPSKRLSKLFELSAIEVRLEEEEKMESCYKSLVAKIKDLSDKEIHDALVAMVSQNSGEDVSMGLLYGILTNPQVAPKYYRDLTLITRDSFVTILAKLNWLIIEMFNKMLEVPKMQLIWIIQEAIKSNVTYIENVCINLMRQVEAGSVSSQNLWLIETLLTILNENKAWLDKMPIMIGYSVFFFLRSIPDHIGPQYEALRNKEIKYCITYLRERFMDCLNIMARELGRALIFVSKIPEFEKLWADIIHNPSCLSPQLTGVWQLISFPHKRNTNRILLCRLTTDIERKIYYFLNNVPMNSQKYYLEWLQKQHLSLPDSQSLRSDLIRYVCCLVHPTNLVLASDIVPRWSFIMWLMTTCPNAIEVQLMRMTLFYDWLFFDPEKDSIMNIEPALLLLLNALKNQPLLALSLMDFLCRTVMNFIPSVIDQVKSCVHASFRQLLDKKVVQSLSPLFDSPKFDSDLRCLIREVFDEFCTPKEEKLDAPHPINQQKIAKTDDALDDVTLNADDSSDLDHKEDEAKFSEDELEIVDDAENGSEAMENDRSSQLERRRSTSNQNQPLAIWHSDGDLINPFDDPVPLIPPESILQPLDPSLRPLLDDLQKTSEDDYVRGDRIYKILIQILSLDTFDEEQAAALAEYLSGLFRPFFARKVFPEKYDNESDLEETFQAPIFVIFRNLCLTPEDEFASRRPQLLLTSEMYLKQPRVGYLMLYFLISNNTGGDRTSSYRDMCKMLDEEVDDMLIKDLKLCQQDDYRLFIYMIPHIYRKFPQFALQSAELMHLVVSTVDAVQLQDIICEIVQGNLTMFRKDHFTQLLNASLTWETIEQYFFWQLVGADDIPIDWVLPILPKLLFPNHAEAMACVLLMLKRMDKEPTMLLIRHLLSREPKKKCDMFCVSALKILIDDFEDKTVDLISSLLTKSSAESFTQPKVKKPPAKILTLDSILGHLDMFRQYNKQAHQFFSKDPIQQALQDVKKTAPESLKAKFSDLFGMMEILDSVKDSRHSRRSRKSAQAHQAHDSSDDEKAVVKSPPKPPVKKKRKVVESDSE